MTHARKSSVELLTSFDFADLFVGECGQGRCPSASTAAARREAATSVVRHCNLDPDAGTVRISRRFAELQDGRWVAAPPKSAAGVRVVALPAMLVEVFKPHADRVPGGM